MPASVRDVARAAGVSVGTVSNVLNKPDRVAPDTVARVQAAIERLGFVRNEAARQLRAGRSSTIGIIVLDLGNPFFTELARGAEERAREAGLSVLVAHSSDDPDRERASLDLFEEQRAFGVLLTPVAEDAARLRRMRDRGIPTVLVDAKAADPTFSSVAVDDLEGGRLAAAHLLALGRRRLVFAGGPATLPQVADRLDGARRAVAAHRGATLEHLDTPALTVEEGRRLGHRIAEREPAQRPDAIFAANDLVALGVLQTFVMAGGIRVPEEIALIGYDDIDFAAAAVVPLSSVRQPARLIGSTAVDLLSAQPSSPDSGRHLLFRPELVVRASTAG
ncbi:MAG: LacI family DNA-binding transcriptional regulator [Microbacterium sp.]